MKTVELHFPKEGVNRRLAERQTDKRGSYPCPWAVNVRLNDNIDRRLRGGSRPGLTKYLSGDFGTTIADMISIDVSLTSGAGVQEKLFVLVDSGVATGNAVALVGYLVDDADVDNILTDDAGNRILISSIAAPATGFLVSGQQQVIVVDPATGTVYQIDPQSGQVDDIKPSAGTVPVNSTFGAVYRDRLCLAGKDNAVYMSRQGNYKDWDYGKDVGDNGRAIPFQLSLSSDVGPLTTAMIAHKDSTMLLASARTLWVLRGDPTTGNLQRVSENVGILSSRSWTTVDDTVYFLSNEGIYQVGADGSGLSPLSEGSVPVELRNVNPQTTTIFMEYEHDREAIHLYLENAKDGTDTYWVFEIQSKAWWPMRFQVDHTPLAVCRHQGKLLLAGKDGYVRYVGGSDDDGTAIESHCVIGPMKLGSIDRGGIINMVHGMLAAGSGTVNWRVVIGATAEEAGDNAKLAIEAFQAGNSYATYVKASDSWLAGRSLAQYPRVSSAWACIWLQSTAKWAMEGGTMQVKLSGRYR